MATMTSWKEEGTLVDMKNRLEKIRVDQSRQIQDDEPMKKDTLKILQSKFGTPVYDPTSPQQKAYDRRCARSGRRKSIEFEDLYVKKGSGLLQFPASLGKPKTSSGGATHRKHPLCRSSSGADYSSQLPAPQAGHPSPGRARKSSDPSSYFRKGGEHGGSHARTKPGAPAPDPGRGQPKVGQGHKGQGQRGILSMTLSEEEKRAIDRKLAEAGGGEEGGCHHVTPPQRRKKISKAGSLQ